MRLLLCCESYPPHRGGVQEVMRQIAERMAARGHDVTVATSRHPERTSECINGVKVRSFDASGKMAYSLSGEIDAYREFVRTFEPDAILIMAAQQWSFDALWPVLDEIAARKVFIPCGFSGLYEPDFADYFRDLPRILKKFDHLVFNAEKYRDIDFVRNIGLRNFTVVPNGISEIDFDREPDRKFRGHLSIPEDAFLFLTVGNPVANKGHREVVEAFLRLDTGGRSAVLLAIAAWPPRRSGLVAGAAAGARLASRLALRVIEASRRRSWRGIRQEAARLHRDIRVRLINSSLGHYGRFADAAARRLVYIGRAEGLGGVYRRVSRRLVGSPGPATMPLIQPQQTRSPAAAPSPQVPPSARMPRRPESIEAMAAKASAQPLKRVILTDLDRASLVQAYMAADLFVFASRIEYSPLVLFEAAAAGTPFLTVPVGNADEIVRWTGAGILCEATKDDRGYTSVDPQRLAEAMAAAMRDPAKLARLGRTGRERWRTCFTWDVVVGYYEDILSGRDPQVRISDFSRPSDRRDSDFNGQGILNSA